MAKPAERWRAGVRTLVAGQSTAARRLSQSRVSTSASAARASRKARLMGADSAQPEAAADPVDPVDPADGGDADTIKVVVRCRPLIGRCDHAARRGECSPDCLASLNLRAWQGCGPSQVFLHRAKENHQQ